MRKRDGVVLVCVLVCLGIATTITGLTVRSTLMNRRQMIQQWQLEQTHSLLDAGVRRTIAKHRAGDESWDAPWNVSETFSRYAVARTTIALEPNSPDGRTMVRVIAELQSDHQTPSITRRSRTIVLPKVDATPAESPTQPKQEN
jgi:hypothetical protein